MKGKALFVRSLVGVLIVLLAVPPGTFAQSSGANARFSQEELDQMLAPIALYPDSLLANILVAATYPDQVMEADQWVKSNSGLQGDQLNAAVDKMDWDLSVKALVPFPKVLDMMSGKQEWTQTLGEAFLAQEADVMDSVQKLRSKAHAQGHLKNTREQKVVVKGQSIEILPANPQVVYVPVYNPTVVYGAWWYPAYPPFAYSPFYPTFVYDPSYVVPGLIAVGAFGFGAAIAVGSFWNVGWGHWDWGRRDVVVNVNRTVNINRTDIRSTSVRTTSLNRAVRQGKIGSPSTRKAALQGTGKRTTAESVQKGLQKRQAETRRGQAKGVKEGRQAGMKQAQGKKAAVRQGKGKQAGVKSQGKRAGVKQGRGQGKAVSGTKASQRGAVSRGGKGTSRGPAMRGGGAGRGASLGKAPRTGGGARGGGPRAGGGKAGRGKAAGGQKR